MVQRRGAEWTTYHREALIQLNTVTRVDE